MTTDWPRSAVVGVGNPTMGDDGVGQAVIDRLDEAASGDESVRATFAGTTGFFALEAMDGADRAVVVDAVDAVSVVVPTRHHARIAREHLNTAIVYRHGPGLARCRLGQGDRYFTCDQSCAETKACHQIKFKRLRPLGQRKRLRL